MYHNFVKESDTFRKDVYDRTYNPDRRYQTQYDDDYNYFHEIQRRQEEEWRRKRREEEEYLMKDKPKTFEYTTPYQASNPPRDINKYFHDSKYMMPPPEEKPDAYYFGVHAPFKQNPGTGMSTYERAFVAPRYGYVHEQKAGGLYMIRFQDNDTAYEEVVVSLREQQPIIKSNFGYILGIARKHHVYPMEGDAGWLYSKSQHHRHPGIRIPCKNVEEAIAVFWFPSKDKAQAFFNNSFHNRFRDPTFPTPHSFEAYYIPLLTPPILSNLNTYLIVEVLNARRYYPEHFQEFQKTAGEAISHFTQTNLRFIASAMEGRADFKPKTMFDSKSKVFISRFDSMVQLSELWETKNIQRILSDSGITGPRNVWAFSLQDWDDRM